jgi:putative glycosyl hydrolase
VTLLAIVLTVLALSLLAASPAAAARSEFFGIVQGQLDDGDLQGMRAARVRSERFEFGWRAVEPTQGSYRWGPLDGSIGALASHGIRPTPFVFGSPRWVAPKPAIPPIDSAAHEAAWRTFLRAAVARYGPGGSYWANEYPQRYPGATRLPIQSWQVWNEPNLRKYFDPEGSDQQTAQKYARLLRISHDAIKSQDPQAEIVLAGNPGYPPSGGLRAWDFLDALYRVGGVKSYFDVAALHPYSGNVNGLRTQIQKFRAVMKKRGDQETPLWLTEFGWGSAPPDRFGINQGIQGQERLLREAFTLILQNRKAWRVEHLFWFLWRDPAPDSAFAHRCSFCGSAGLLRYNRTGKPAYDTFRGFTAETTPPQASITLGPSQGGVTNDPTPTFKFASNEAGSTFVCRVDARAFQDCRSPHRVPQLADGAHTFYVKAIDAPGNESVARSRSFTVDTTAPATTITSGPSGSTADSTPSFSFGSSEPGSTFQCRFDSQAFAPCSGPGNSHTPSTPLPGGNHSFAVRATDRAENTDPTPAKRTFSVATP